MKKEFSLSLATLLIAASLLAPVGCAHVDSSGTVEFAKDAETNYALGLKAMNDRRHLDAVQYFEHIRYRHPYAAVAALADLALADNYFAQDRFTEAAESYQNFVTLRPHHPKVDYAEYRKALSHYEDIPFDLLIFPPSYEKDQTAVRGAAKSFSEFLKRYPESAYAKEAQEKLQEVVERLVDHEMSVGKFYAHHERYKSAASRFQVVLRDFPGSKRVPEALDDLISAQVAANDYAGARQSLAQLVATFPASQEAKNAGAIQKKIDESEQAFLKKKAKAERKVAEEEAKNRKQDASKATVTPTESTSTDDGSASDDKLNKSSAVTSDTEDAPNDVGEAAAEDLT